MPSSDEFKQGEFNSDLRAIKEGMVRIEASLTRFGERTGELETKHAEHSTSIEVLKTAGQAALEDVKDLKASRNWFIVAIVGGFIAALWKMLTGIGSHK